MKAIIMETDRKQAVAMSEDGRIRHIRNRGYEIGQSIEIGERNIISMKNRTRNLVAGIAAAVLITAGGGTAYAYNNPVAEVSVDVNPSIVYKINTFGDAIDAVAVDEDSKLVLEIVDWDGEDIEKVLNNTIKALKKQGYLSEENWYEEGIVIGVSAKSTDKEEQLIEGIRNRLERIVSEETNKEVDLDTEDGPVIGIGEDRVLEAARFSEKFGIEITPGKLNLVQKLSKSYERIGEDALTEAAIENWIEEPVKDIMAQIKENRQAEAEKEDKTTPPGLVNKVTPPGFVNSKDRSDPDTEAEEEKEVTPAGLVNKTTPPGLMKKEELKESGKASE